jgi:hypothetical protein
MACRTKSVLESWKDRASLLFGDLTGFVLESDGRLHTLHWTLSGWSYKAFLEKRH